MTAATMTLKERLAFLAAAPQSEISDPEFRDAAVLACADALAVISDLEADRDIEKALARLTTTLEQL